MKKRFFFAAAGMTALALSGCSAGSSGKDRTYFHAQSETHPEHLGLLAFKEYVEERLGDKYEVRSFLMNCYRDQPRKPLSWTQTGAIDFVVAGTANLETFAGVYEIFSMPYLFDSEEVYKSVMEDSEYMENVYESTDEAGFRVVTWYNAGTRNFYAKTPIIHRKIKRVKKSVCSRARPVLQWQMPLAAAAPMGFGEVYTAIQQGVIDGAENNELALTNNKHGEVAKYYTYNKHQMVPDMLVANLKFLNSLSPEEYQVFKEAARKSTEVELEEWDKSIEEAKKIATDDMGVEFIDVDVNAFKQKVASLHEKDVKG